MPGVKYLSDAIHQHVNELTSRIVANSGIPSDRFHLGKILLQTFKDYPTLTLQIDGATGESETYGSMLKRSVICAMKLKKLGLQRGDVMVLMAPNHLDTAAPFYAALYLGIIIGSIDFNFGIDELRHTFSNYKPAIIFCQNDKLSDIKEAVNNLELHSKIVTFDKGDECCFSDFMDLSVDDETIENFKPSELDPEDTLAVLIQTSGTTEPPKAAAVTHKNLAVSSPYIWSWANGFPTSIKLSLVLTPLRWLSAIIHYIVGPYVRIPRIQTSQPITNEHIYQLIKTYKPSFLVINPRTLIALLNSDDFEKSVLTCFQTIMLTGTAVQKELLTELKDITPKTQVINGYAMTELTSLPLLPYFSSKPESCGKPIGSFEYRLVNIDTGEDVDEPNAPGELWLKGPGIFKGYYNNPTATAKVFAEDNWFKTGDIFYRDRNWDFYYMERIKLLLKYKSQRILPSEVEAVILRHPGVLAAVVTSVPDPECGDLPVACVVPRRGHAPTAQEIKDLVKESLEDAKQLRGGVVFLNALPMTATGKAYRRKVKSMVLEMARE